MPLDHPIVPVPLEHAGDPLSLGAVYVGDGYTFTLAEYRSVRGWVSVARGPDDRPDRLPADYGKALDTTPRFLLAVPAEFAPAPTAQPQAAPADGRSEGWDCGNGALQARLVLSLVDRNAITDAAAIEALGDLAYEAGPDFCRQMIADAEVPF